MVLGLEGRPNEPATAGTVHLELALGDTIYQAIRNGIPITLRWQLRQRNRAALWTANEWQVSGSRQIGFRSLREQFTLTEQASPAAIEANLTAQHRSQLRRFNSRAALEHALSQLVLPPLTRDLSASPEFRVWLDAGELPPPMRLPVRLNGGWRLDSGWQLLQDLVRVSTEEKSDAA